MMLLWQVAGAALGAAGIAALYASWQRKGSVRGLAATGWLFIAASILAWSRTSGIDEGPALGIVSIALTGLLAVGYSAIRTPVKARRTARVRIALNEDDRPDVATGVCAKVLSLLVITGLGLAASLTACGALFLVGRSAGFEHTGNLATAMFAFPLVWAGLATWVGYSANPARGSAVLGAIVAASLAFIGLSMAGA